MSSNAIRWVAGVMVVLAVLLAIVAYKYSHSFAASQNAKEQQSASPQPSVPQTLVVVATKPLPLDKPIDRDSVALVPVQVAPLEFYTNVNDVVGKPPRLDVDAGTPLTPRFFKRINILANQIPLGSQALSLRVDDVVGAGGFILPGDVVDVLIYIRSVTGTPTGEAGKDKTEDIATQARLLLKNALVLSYEDRLVDAPKGIDEKEKTQNQQNQQRRERTAVIAVPQADVTRVMLGANLGDLRLSLHRPEPPVEPTAPVVAAEPSATVSTTPGLAGAASSSGSAASAGSSVAAVSAIPADSSAPATTAPATLPLNDAEKAKIEAAKVPDMVITAAELGRVRMSPAAEKKKKVAAAAKPKVEIFRGSAIEKSVYP